MGIVQNITTDDAAFVGDDRTLRFTIYADTTGAAQDITGWTIQFKMAATVGGAAVVTKSATLTTPASGICSVALLAADTSGLTSGTYFYELKRTDSGNVGDLAHGIFVLQPRPT